jgi:selenophosphate synthase
MTTNVQSDVFADHVPIMADVSGHGLAGSLVDLAERLRVSIDVTVSPRIALSERVLSEEITLFENEWSDYGRDVQADEDAKRLVSLKETAGPLVALSRPMRPMEEDRISAAGWMRIGDFARGKPGVRIQWSE